MAVPNGIYAPVELHYNGVFIRNPLSYANGLTFTVEDHDFSSDSYAEFVTWLVQYMQESFKKVYYCEAGKTLGDEILPIRNEVDYAGFIYDVYGTDGKVSLYVDHEGAEIEEWLNDEASDEEEIPEDEVLDENDEHLDSQENDEELVEVDVTLESVTMNRTVGDEFLNKLCGRAAEEDVNDDDDSDVEEEDEVGIEPGQRVHAIYNDSVHWKRQKPILGMRFQDPGQLKAMLCNYAVANGYQLCFTKNDKKRLLVKCCKGECSFRLWASWMSEEETFQIKSLKCDHTCARNFSLGPLVTYAWIGSHYTKEILHRQKLSVRKLRLEVIKKFGVKVSVSECRRAKKYALPLIEGNLVEHYAKLWSYAEEIRRSNPSSTVKLDVTKMPDGNNYFSKFYVCFNGVKKGWIDGCRKIIGLDGCFLKGLCKGELISAIGRDANNQIFPIAWAVVCVENKENWKWFLDHLTDDLNLGLGNGTTLMSDQHKGLIQAVKEMLPFAEHRQCARHICQNLKKRYSGAQYEKLFWKACKATTEAEFKVHMKELESLNPSAYKFLMDKDPKTWSRSFYQTGRCCASIENGMSESFNSLVVDARKKPIITMLEEIRLYMMERLYTLKQKGQSWGNQLCPAIRTLANDLKREQRNWQVMSGGLNQFEVRGINEAFEVDLDRRTCSCRLWQLNGYGCVHSVACICYLNRDVEAYVDPMYNTTTYMKSYRFSIRGMNGSSMWPETEYIPPLPPQARRMPGRPTIKRKKDAVENQTRHTISKAGKKGKCSICKLTGHNKKTCPQKVSETDGSNQENAEGLDEADEEQFEADQMEADLAEMAAEMEAEMAADMETEMEYEMELTPPLMEELTPVEPNVQFEEVAQQVPEQVDQQVPEQVVEVVRGRTPIAKLLENIRRKKSERILNLKLSKTIGGPNAPGNSVERALELE